MLLKSSNKKTDDSLLDEEDCSEVGINWNQSHFPKTEVVECKKMWKGYSRIFDYCYKVMTLASEMKPFDFMKMVDEMRALREKYAMPKGILLVPDKLEIQVQRIAYDRFHLSYKECFDYLPNEVLNIVIPATMNMMGQIGVPKEKITRIAENCVGMDLDGDFVLIVGAVLAELLIQKRFDEDETVSFLSTIARIVKAFSEWSSLEFEWNSEIEKRYYDSIRKLSEIMQTHPTLLSEIEAIVKKCAQPSEISESDKSDENVRKTAT
jgi:hypothetical protein